MALAALNPVLIVGGEQTLFAVTPDGKVYATGELFINKINKSASHCIPHTAG